MALFERVSAPGIGVDVREAHYQDAEERCIGPCSTV